ncbi:hypothetical protein JD844_010673 [Phrynosoma platyrhinos]|uniref:Histone deacetylase n=1 Tax=Phrynosoma platyrhinos TaxID=52577 RepID=A0ABQ7TGV7_PHRPL|nr:hypothetical protein JD844_010673 [Phrynosoma platyrhinos]
MDLRIGQRLAKPSPDTALLALKQTQLQHQFFMASLHQQQVEQLTHPHLRVPMEPPTQDPVTGKQEQELRLLLHKDKSKRSAVASMVVKQKLAEVILKKQQAALERTNAPVMPYRSLEPMERESPANPVLPSFFPPVSHRSGDSPEHFPLRKTASEPNLKLRYKAKKAGERRKNPLTRKEISGCSSPNDSLVPEHGALPPAPGLTQETPLAQRLRMQESSLAQFALQPTGSLPALTLGLPASSAAPARGDGDHRTLPGLAHKVPVLTSTHTPLFLPTSLEQHEPGNPLSTRLQPVIILEPSLAHPPLVTVPGLGTVPFHFSHSVLPPERLSVPIHKPLGRTRSEPLPPSSRAVQQQLAYQQHHTLFLERLKQQTLLGKRMSKSEKPRLQQIPSSEDMEAEAGGDLSDLPQSQVEPSPAGTGSKETERSSKLGQPQEEHVLQQAQYAWEQQQRIQQHQLLRRQPPADSLLIPAARIVYDSVMLKHQCSCGDNSNHPEHAGRIQSIWSRLQERGLRNQCECLRGRKATLEELQSVHTERHVLLYGTNPLSRLKLDNGKLAAFHAVDVDVNIATVDSDTIWNELHSSNAARWAAGSVTELAFKVASRQLKVKHLWGFCFFNSVAIAARQLQQKGKISKILIVDWDVHHGNGTQQVFYRDPNVLYISLHRHDNGNFFPGSGAADEVGSGAGEGFTVNVAWTGGLDPPMGDPEYLAAFRTVVMPIAHEFCPDVVLVSAGFDAAEGHPPPLGGYKVSAKCFGYMTQQLMNLAGGALVLALEGGHDLTSICDASEACVSALLGNEVEPLPEETLQQKPNTNAVCSLEAVIQVQSQYWSSVQRFTRTVGYSFLEAQRHNTEEVETVTALASLSVMAEKRQQDEPMEEEPMN